ncbi:MAG: hypothetical protein HY221_02745 [Candidatus Sungbacteria bacterium]|uniref:Uncharacterized protein n=1 Tax=Candidatus Sungiibacteriota bacterium TaxID=2750080 RepID=A0A932QYN6_9BACT|nr:hypothetical protein [Candidatus Sungbacteria bacterium]
MNHRSDRGFVALISAIIISAVLLLVIAASGLIAFYSRFNILDFELKERSNAAADACVDEALLQIAQDPSYIGGTSISLSPLDKCWIGTVTGSGQETFKVQATSSDTAVTNLQVTFDTSNFSVVSWQEIPTF